MRCCMKSSRLERSAQQVLLLDRTRKVDDFKTRDVQGHPLRHQALPRERYFPTIESKDAVLESGCEWVSQLFETDVHREIRSVVKQA